MKRKNLLYTAIAALLLFSSCINELRKDDFADSAISGLIKVKLEMPEGFESQSTEGMKILFTDNTTGLEYSATAGADGTVDARVAYGTYTVSAEQKVKEGRNINIFNGMQAGLMVTPNENTANVTINLKHSKSSQIIIKEFYYGGCKNLVTGKNYTNKDHYFILYNNSDEVAYLDSLCIGVAYPWNAPTNGKPADFVKPGTTELRDSIPCSTAGWMFQGTGKDKPLNPGEEVVVCLNAIDHTQITPNSVNLGIPGYYALYDNVLGFKGQSTPEAGVNTLEGFWKAGKSTTYIISINSPALFIFTMGGKSSEDFVRDTYTINPSSPANANFACLLVDKRLVLDGVECFRNNNDTKRFVPEVDNGFIATPGSGQGYSVHRNIDTEATAAAGGRIVYQDTNNSSNDFYVRDTASLTGK